jgi:hypothetical protein
MDMEYNISQELRTPIKRIKNLTLTSPTFQFLPPNLYPSLDQLDIQMTDKGYSRKLTTNVLEELNARATSVLANTTNTTHSSPAQSHRNPGKRFSAAHHRKFGKMELISSHYAATRRFSPQAASLPPRPTTRSIQRLPNPSHQADALDQKRVPDEVLSSVTKRRRTLLGAEEVPNPPPLSPLAPPLLMQPCIESRPQMNYVASSIDEIDSSPIRKISPSKGSLNLNELLHDYTTKTTDISPTRALRPAHHSAAVPVRATADALTVEHQFLKPRPILRAAGPAQAQVRLRMSLLELAGVKHSGSPATKLAKASSHSCLPTNHSKTNIPVLTKRPSVPRFDTSRPPSRRGSAAAKPNITIPQPFLLYNKPTIASSQKSIDCDRKEPSRSLKHKALASSLPPQKRTESRFLRFFSKTERSAR